MSRGGKRPGAGRKPGSNNPMVMFFIRVPADLKEKLSYISTDTIRDALSEIVAPRN